ncbi:F0F1 ATP synthase subunit delta [Virgibacillus alimentarius]|uniref:ATP synthase subunit delta n=1 Tax=Virgibacillus alimentarius TaxID=698769 RepID=A0ABS4SBS6_9BACI|nr:MULTISPECIES: F0F1 ATP synthase subunit delta [Virgibacillus]MBP2258963.1 F-type H+-transporting ATPase subunit delta [Virgibacillus alimentarius]HLR67724.1 F0F1 ATP synthase subunit delta [Virgibacillus sp.]
MSDAVVAKRYAEALFQLGKEKANLDQLVEELQVVREVFQTNQKLYTFLEHPRISIVTKKQFLDEAFKGLGQDVVNTIKLLVERHRSVLTPSIISHFMQMVNDAKGINEAVVYSVKALSDAEKEQLEKSLAKRLNTKSVKLENKVDPSVVGGLKIRIGNTILDGTINGKLRRIKRDIITANR